jgi:hypothetical protein
MYNQIIIQKQSWKLPNKWRIQALPIIINLKKRTKKPSKTNGKHSEQMYYM